MREPLLNYIEKYKIPQRYVCIGYSSGPLSYGIGQTVFQATQCCIENNEYIIGFQQYIDNRTKSKKAEAYKAEWLKDVKVLLDFKNEKLYEINTVFQLANYYQSHFAPLIQP